MLQTHARAVSGVWFVAMREGPLPKTAAPERCPAAWTKRSQNSLSASCLFRGMLLSMAFVHPARRQTKGAKLD